MSMQRIGFLGTGHIAAPMVRHLVRKGFPVTVSRRNEAVSAALAREHGVAVADNQAVIDASDVVVLCLRPHLAQDTLAPLEFRADQGIVSVMAGVGRETLSRLCAPAADMVQTIPLGYLEAGGCPLAAYGNDRLLIELFSPENPVVKVGSEVALNDHFAICAFVPGLLDLMATAAQWLGARSGEVDGAEFYTTQLVAGFLGAMQKGGSGRLLEERDALATEGTLSLQMTTALRDGGAHDALEAVLGEIGRRLST